MDPHRDHRFMRERQRELGPQQGEGVGRDTRDCSDTFRASLVSPWEVPWTEEPGGCCPGGRERVTLN